MKNRIGESNINNQGYKMTIIEYKNRNYINVQFEDGSISYNKCYSAFKKGAIKHPIQYEESFAYHIEVELGLNLDDIWNWERNKVNPYEIYKSSNKKVWLYCQEHDYHNYDENENKIGYKIVCYSFYNGKRCGYCNSFASHKVHHKDSLAYNYPQIAKMIAIEENNLSFEDCYNISCFSNKKFYFKCDKCNTITENKVVLQNITNRGFSCRYCSDGISIPNKFMTNVLKQLNEEFITELSSKDFSGKNYFYYDFYIPKCNMIIEMNGVQHYEECNLTKRTLFEEQMNDLFKYKCAKGHVNNYIVIDCRYSTLEWMKENIIKELSNYFDLSSIDWELAWEESQNSLCVRAWELWNSGMYDLNKIGKMLNLSSNTIRKYLKIGKEINKCLYTKD